MSSVCQYECKSRETPRERVSSRCTNNRISFSFLMTYAFYTSCGKCRIKYSPKLGEKQRYSFPYFWYKVSYDILPELVCLLLHFAHKRIIEPLRSIATSIADIFTIKELNCCRSCSRFWTALDLRNERGNETRSKRGKTQKGTYKVPYHNVVPLHLGLLAS